MQKITLDAKVLSQVGPLETEVEICDESGQTLGFLLPPDLHREMMYAWAKAQFWYRYT